MKKIPLIGINISVAFLIVLASFSNVAGVQTFKIPKQKIIKDEIDYKELLFQTMFGITNNQELQKKIPNVINRLSELRKKIEHIGKMPCNCGKDILYRWSFPFICLLLFPIFIFALMLAFGIGEGFEFLEYLGEIGINLNCFWSWE